MGSLGQNVGESLRVSYAKALHNQYLLAKYQKKFGEDAAVLPPAEHKINKLSGYSSNQPAGRGRDTSKSICIIGAGAAGLAAAMQLQASEYTKIDILEASPRAGGRLFTYEFPEKDGCTHNYCDIGAMRIPDIPRMQPTLELINEKLKIGESLKPYYYDPEDKAQAAAVPKMWFFQDSRPESKDFVTCMDTLLLKFGFLVADPLNPKKPKAGKFDVALEQFLGGDYDFYSTRSWLMNNTDDNKRRFTYAETVVAELATTGRNGSFDQALLETICDYLDFQQAFGVNWHRLEGGMKVLVDAMVKKVESVPGATIKCNTPVIALENDEDGKKIIVTTTTGPPIKYDAVFCSTSMPCLQRMDISKLRLPETILTGIRLLAYDRSAKVAIKFKSAWWLKRIKSPGGVSSTDLPISNIVYPSFDIKEGEPAVLLASYSWSQDATRMGALFNNDEYKNGPNRDSVVVTQVLKNIATMWHKSDPEAPTYDELRDAYVNHFAFSWDQDPYTGGAFALFGPGQFREIYPCFKDPQCQGKFMMCGEALSTEHAWIAGALNSSYASVMAWLETLQCTKAEYGQALLKASPLGGGEDKHPAEFTEDLMYWTAQLAEIEVPPPVLTAVAA